ncbi:unnamed protein product [Hermetia illucens]|uniref:Retrovirus-related Pol polyprotein from transposon TNT 1-94 n=1 Tax=Hermetia illucens TaxID=343691 RepID=A0A7R8UG25_HERIL|nr:unnamed protein product [Hermetia illucens]
MLLLQKFHGYRMESNESVVQHVNRVQNMASQLKDLGEAISDTAIMAKVLGSLHKKYNVLQTVWDRVSEERQTLDNLLERLLKEERRLESDDDITRALAAFSLGGNKKKKFAANQNKNMKENRENRNESVECFYCKRKGHLARDCRKKKRDTDNANENPRKCTFVASTREHKQLQGKSETVPNSEVVERLMAVDTSDVWITDSGASRHITYRWDWYSEFESSSGESISLGGNGVCEVTGTCTVLIDRLVNGKWCKARIENVLYVPKIRKNLFSVGVCTDKGFDVLFKGKLVTINLDGEAFDVGVQQDNQIYRMLFKVRKPSVAREANVSTVNLRVWHERMGHVNNKVLREMAQKGLIRGVKLADIDNFFCESCAFGKAHRLSFKKNETNRKTKPGPLCGPFSTESIGGARFCIIFKDDASGFRYVYFMKHKSDVFDIFQKYEKLNNNKFGKPMKILRTDNGREYCNLEMKRYLEARGIEMVNTAPYTPQQNGKAEHDNRTIIESARTMITAKKLPLSLWAKAVGAAVTVLNRVLATGKAKTLYEIWFGKTPDVSHFRVFGSDAYMHIDKQFRKKLDPKATKLILVGYQNDSMNCRLYNPQNNKIYISRDVIFNEKSQLGSEIGKEFEYILPADENEDVAKPVEQQQEEECLEAQEEYKNQLGNDRQLRDCANIHRPIRFEIDFTEYNPPNTFQEAMNSGEVENWAEAIQEELDAHEQNETWSTVPRKTDRKPIDSKWLFKVIRDTSGDVYRYKARLCARGFQQKQGLDYTETFSPVVRYDSLRVLLAMVTEQDLELTQFDFSETEADKCIFRGQVDGVDVFFAFFVDDGLIAAKTSEALESAIKSLKNTFEITIGDGKVFVGVQIERNRVNKTMFLHQEAYVKKILNEFKMVDAKAASIRTDPHAGLVPNDRDDESPSTVPFREAVGSLMFLAVVMRPDIIYSVNSVSKFLSNHNESIGTWSE